MGSGFFLALPGLPAGDWIGAAGCSEKYPVCICDGGFLEDGLIFSLPNFVGIFSRFVFDKSWLNASRAKFFSWIHR